jgi:hypothetical protein
MTTNLTSAESCPFIAPSLTGGERLLLAMPKRMVVQYRPGAEGGQELCLYYDDKEISFDEPDLFPFGETLARQGEFLAADAADWGPGYEWDRVRGLLDHLVAEGILEVSDGDTDSQINRVDRTRPSPLPPAPAATPRGWDECEAITAELTGRAVEPGYLELIVPVFRIAHIALDSDNRQVGEANVFPRALRVDTPTEWAACPFSGTRYLSDRPMNVTALKAMRDHWPQMMAALSAIRARFLTRFPESGKPWTVGQIERLSSLVLAVVTYPTVRCDRPMPNGSLDPALSCLFRVTDGLRMTMHQMMFVPIGEPTIPPDTPVTSAEILDYAERNYSFHSETGVCAGPNSMVREFLATLVDGAGAAAFDSFPFDAAVQAALDDIEAAFDYGLHGLRSYAAIYSVWPLMIRHYEQIAEIVVSAADGGTEALAGLRNRLAERLTTIRHSTYLASEEWRRERVAAYEDMYGKCAAGLRDPSVPVSLQDELIRMTSPVSSELEAALVSALRRALDVDGTCNPAIESIADTILRFSIMLQAILRVACESQERLNAVLGRRRPARRFNGFDVNVHNRLLDAGTRQLPYLLDEIVDAFGIRIDIDTDFISVTPLDRNTDGGDVPSTGMVPAG